MFTMSAKELAPTEDEGIIFAILDSSPLDLDQNRFFADAVNRVYTGTPENDFTFQATYPSSVSRAWS